VSLWIFDVFIVLFSCSLKTAILVSVLFSISDNKMPLATPLQPQMLEQKLAKREAELADAKAQLSSRPRRCEANSNILPCRDFPIRVNKRHFCAPLIKKSRQ
jgi:hypothetical protein